MLRFRHVAHSRLSGGEGRCTWRGYTYTTRAITHVFMQIMSENISLNYGIIFQASEHFRGPYSRKPRCITQSMVSYSLFRFISQEGNTGEKIKAYHSLQNTLISQQRTSQIMRWSPPGFSPEIGFCLYRWTNSNEETSPRTSSRELVC